MVAAARGCPRFPPRRSMVRRGSAVRVRQRALTKPCKPGHLVVCSNNARVRDGYMCGTCGLARARTTTRDPSFARLETYRNLSTPRSPCGTRLRRCPRPARSRAPPLLVKGSLVRGTSRATPRGNQSRADRLRRSRKPLSVVRRIEGSNPSPPLNQAVPAHGAASCDVLAVFPPATLHRRGVRRGFQVATGFRHQWHDWRHNDGFGCLCLLVKVPSSEPNGAAGATGEPDRSSSRRPRRLASAHANSLATRSSRRPARSSVAGAIRF